MAFWALKFVGPQLTRGAFKYLLRSWFHIIDRATVSQTYIKRMLIIGWAGILVPRRCVYKGS